MSGKFHYKKALGQHFLNDDAISAKIVEAFLSKCETDKTLEIGPGAGALTKRLAPEAPGLHLSEADERLFGELSLDYPKAKLIQGDFLNHDWPSIMNGPFSIIGNLPYNISSPILFKVLEWREHIPLFVAMFQKEVAQRVVAAPGSRIYGIPSVLLSAFYERTLLIEIPKESFTPAPKVDSAVVMLERKAVQPDLNWSQFKAVVKIAFGQRRKKLGNALFSLGPKERILYADQRAEQMSFEQFIEISNHLHEGTGH